MAVGKKATLLVFVGLLVATTTALPTTAELKKGPFMCNHEKDNNVLDFFLVQTGSNSGCAEGDEGCERTPNYQDDQMRKTNWTATDMESRHDVDCENCQAAVQSLNDFCRANQGRSKDLALDFMQVCARLRPHDSNMAKMCLTAYETAADLYCPMDPCVHVLEAIQLGGNAICGSAAIDCAGTGKTNKPPEEELYGPMQAAYEPRWRIPPLSCSQYVKLFQGQCRESKLPQWDFCRNLDGHPRSGCLHMAQVLLRVPTIMGTGDLCTPLFNPLQQEMDPAARTAVDPKDVCLITLGFPDQRPLPIEEWLEQKKEFDRIKLTPTPTPTPTAFFAVPTPTVEDTGDRPCVDAPTPTPIPRGIVQMFARPIGYRTVMEDKKRIDFQCDATKYWADVRPSLGCHFSQFNVRTAGFDDPSQQYPCACTCSGLKADCPANSVRYWSDVRSPNDCAQMICHSNRFSQCMFRDTIVAENASWNGEQVVFNSIALQDTCQNAAGSGELKDWCGVVVSGATPLDVPRLMRWTLRTADGGVIGDSGDPAAQFGSTSTLRVPAIWLPCGDYTLDLIDNSFNGKGWDTTPLVFKDRQGFVMHTGGKVRGGDAHHNMQHFSVTGDSIRMAKEGLCQDCDSDLPLPCKVPTDQGKAMCVPFMHGTNQCPPGAIKC